MTDRELKKLNRQDLLEILVEQQKQIDELEREVHALQLQQKDQMLEVEEAGSLAEAALRLNHVFEAAQEASQMYQKNIRKRADDEAQAILAEAKEQVNALIEETKQRCMTIEANAKQHYAPQTTEATV